VRIYYSWALDFVGSPNLPPKVHKFGILSPNSNASNYNQILIKQVEIRPVQKFGIGSLESGDVRHRRRISVTRFRQNWLESSQYGQNMTSLPKSRNIVSDFGQPRFERIWLKPDTNGRFYLPSWEFGQPRFWPPLPESGQFSRNPASRAGIWPICRNLTVLC
jgi:hypothetical protein